MRLLMAAAIVFSMLSSTGNAHHSYTEFDDKQTIEIEGTLTTAGWQNPHANLVVRTLDGRTVQVETAGVNYLRRLDAPLDLYKVGSTVKVAGWPSKRSDSRMYGTNILSSDGQELVLWRAAPRWRPTAVGVATPAMFGPAIPADAPQAVYTKTLFQVWGTVYDDLDAIMKFDPPPSPTEAALKARASIPIDDTIALGCRPKGMWAIMGQPFPFDFVDQGNTILLRIEEYDSVRTIHMDGGEVRTRRREHRSAIRWVDGRVRPWSSKPHASEAVLRRSVRPLISSNGSPPATTPGCTIRFGLRTPSS